MRRSKRDKFRCHRVSYDRQAVESPDAVALCKDTVDPLNFFLYVIRLDDLSDSSTVERCWRTRRGCCPVDTGNGSGDTRRSAHHLYYHTRASEEIYRDSSTRHVS